jgi:hypothetical protein
VGKRNSSQSAGKMTRTPIKRKRSKPRRGPVRDPKYLAWIREQPCCLCTYLDLKAQQFIDAVREIAGTGADITTHVSAHRQATPTEAAHVGQRGLGQKCSDRETIPLCGVEHHRVGPRSAHKLGKLFAEAHGINIAAAVAQYNEMYERTKD